MSNMNMIEFVLNGNIPFIDKLEKEFDDKVKDIFKDGFSLNDCCDMISNDYDELNKIEKPNDAECEQGNNFIGLIYDIQIVSGLKTNKYKDINEIPHNELWRMGMQIFNHLLNVKTLNESIIHPRGENCINDYLKAMDEFYDMYMNHFRDSLKNNWYPDIITIIYDYAHTLESCSEYVCCADILMTYLYNIAVKNQYEYNTKIQNEKIDGIA